MGDPASGGSRLAGRVLLGPEGAFFDSGAVRIHYSDEGQGPPVILIHGFAATGHLNWRLPGVVEALTPEFRVVTLDARGHGRSDKPHGSEHYGLEMVEDVVRLMDHLGLGRAHVAGYSMGGFIALRLATRHPDRILRVAPCGFGWQRPHDNALNVYDVLASAFERGHGFGVLTSWLNPGSRHGAIRATLIDLGADALVDERALASVARALPQLAVTEAELRAIDVPVLSIVGSADPLGPGVDALAGVVPDHRLVVIEGGTHRNTPVDPGFASALRAFFRDGLPGTAAEAGRGAVEESLSDPRRRAKRPRTGGNDASL